MAGTLFGLPLSQQLDEDGDPYSGALLYIYEALTSTPVDTYADHGLSTLNAFPMEADASGRIPQFWVDDGSYRARLTTAGGVEIFDEDSILAIGPSVASTGGGGGGTEVDTASLFSAGDMKWKPINTTETGWVRANGRTIGSGSSGASERASSDTQTLYEFLWNNFSDTLCPVATGRGANALADFGANKAIGTLDMRARGAFGLDDMGNSAAGIITGGTTGGMAGGGYLPSYHEASWTPAFAFGGATTGITYTTQVGRYVRIDDMITAWGTIALSNNGSATGVVTITGLPYAASTVSGLVQSGYASSYDDIEDAGQGLAVSMDSAASVLKVLISEGDVGDAMPQYSQAADNIANTAVLSFAITYRTDDTTAGTTGSNPVLYRLGSWFLKL